MEQEKLTEETLRIVAETQGFMFKRLEDADISYAQLLSVISFFYTRSVAIVVAILRRMGEIGDDYINNQVPEAHDKLKEVLMEQIKSEINNADTGNDKM